jgi:hypothetical protein
VVAQAFAMYQTESGRDSQFQWLNNMLVRAVDGKTCKQQTSLAPAASQLQHKIVSNNHRPLPGTRNKCNNHRT